MPELPEIEHLRRTLAPALIGATVTHVDLRRRDIVRPPRGLPGRESVACRSESASSRPGLLRGDQIVEIRRRGKELAIIGESGNALGVHLGMSGQILLLRKGERPRDASHVHSAWRLQRNGTSLRMIFRDPRRFGGLWSIASEGRSLKTHWASLGPDALTISRAKLHKRLGGTRRAIKVALLDQKLVAGIGNIYADEALHNAGIHPRHPSWGLDDRAIDRLHRSIRRILNSAIDAGGSTIRDYRDGTGNSGDYAVRHQVYGRAGQPCTSCRTPLEHQTVAQRTTTYCLRCQPAAVAYPQGVHTSQHHD